jgi:hypothetical protein
MRFVLAIILSSCAFAGTQAKVLQTVPIRFEQHPQGWIARGLNHAISFTDRATTLRLGDRSVNLTFPGSRSGALKGVDAQAASNYFTGKNYQSVPAFQKLRRERVYPGIDLVYYGNGGELEYDFEIAPGSNPSAIRMHFAGADRVALNERGELSLRLGDGEIVQKAPVVYQRSKSGAVVQVESSYRIAKNGDVRVVLGAYDRSRTLVVDPRLDFAAYLAGSSTDVGIAVAHDGKGFEYVAGNTWSVDFPVTPDAYQSNNLTNQDLFIMKLDLTNGATPIVYCTYLGGAATENLKGMAVDANGVVYITGSTTSGGYPVTSNAYLGSITSNSHGFLSVLDPSQAGSAGLTYSTFIGGANFEEGDALTVVNGKVYVTGYTTSDDFPTVNPIQAGRVAGYDAFISEYDPTQSGTASLIFSTYLGASGQDLPHSIAVDSAGLIYVAGQTFSSDFPTTPLSYKPFYSGDGDGFLTVLNPALGTISYSTLLGGALEDDVKKLVIEPGGHVALTGYTSSQDFPVTQGAYMTSLKGACTTDPVLTCASNAFLTILDLKAGTPLVQGLVYSTYFGGSGGDVALDMQRDASGRYVLGGYTVSTDMPVTPDAFSPVSADVGIDGWIAIIDPSQPANSANQLAYSTFLTGPGSQVVYGLDMSAAGTIYATGFTTSTIFPNGVVNTDIGKMSSYIFSIAPK